ncbi:MAG: hypothetical protein D6702_03060 [Planctomycetota bacterium]|nr:MAG: hypothetical protein D6702_03060 [Planctomycetota bacterium]
MAGRPSEGGAGPLSGPALQSRLRDRPPPDAGLPRRVRARQPALLRGRRPQREAGRGPRRRPGRLHRPPLLRDHPGRLPRPDPHLDRTARRHDPLGAAARGGPDRRHRRRRHPARVRDRGPARHPARPRKGPGRRLTLSRPRPAVVALLVAALGVAAYLPGIGRQEWVGTEDFRVRIAAECVERGDFLVPTFYGRPILTKPPLYYLALATVLDLAGGRSPAEARLLSLLALAATAAAIAWVGARRGGPRCGMVAGFGYLLALNTIKNGVNAEIDPFYAALAVAALLAWWRSLDLDRTGWALAAGLLGAAAALTKGLAVLPLVAAGAAGAAVLPGRPRPRAAIAALLPVAAGLLAWPLALRALPAERLAGAIQESEGFFSAWSGESVIETLLFPFALVVAALPFSLPALLRLRAAGRPALDRFLVAAVVGAVVAMLPSATKATRYLLPYLPLLVLAGVLRLERFAATSRFVAGLGAAALVVAAAAVPVVRTTLDPVGALVLAGLALAGLACWRLAARRPEWALAFLLVPARGLFTQVYVPAWEAAGQRVEPAVERLRQLTTGARTLAVVRTESPRLTDPLALDTRFYWDPKDLRDEVEAGRRFDAILVGIKREEFEFPGYHEVGLLPFEGKHLRVLRPDRP